MSARPAIDDLIVTRGRAFAGAIRHEPPRTFIAFDRDGRKLGKFPSIVEARNAVLASKTEAAS